MKAIIEKQEEVFKPIDIKITLETLEETKEFYTAIGRMKCVYPTDEIYQELKRRFDFV